MKSNGVKILPIKKCDLETFIELARLHYLNSKKQIKNDISNLLKFIEGSDSVSVKTINKLLTSGGPNNSLNEKQVNDFFSHANIPNNNQKNENVTYDIDTFTESLIKGYSLI